MVINRLHLHFSLGAEEVIVGISGHAAHLLQTIDWPLLHQLEEDVVAPLVGLLVSHAGLLQQVNVNETSGQFSHMIEVDTDELSL